ncbi:PH domain-containing protein [Rhodococcus sp. MEB041]|uniref:PH domain-containing protein n=1 Tax=Rhodococcus sp. MEB041 TaxID=3040323 RepID=UPI00254B49B9|nr:PH domain-containing protein [Rhodococcus sp. MEB041]
MDNLSTGGREAPQSWSTPLAAVAALGVGAAALAAAAVATTGDPAGRALIGLAALAALALAAVQRPKLSVDGDVLRIRTLRGTRDHGRDDVLSLRLVPYPRLGRRVPMLEMDVTDGDDERLVIFGRWDLGADPRAVFDTLELQGWVDAGWSQRD